MNYIKKGDIVGRKSYNKDIIFTVKNIIRTKRNDVAILKKVPGIGPKTAQRAILELKDKLKKEQEISIAEGEETSNIEKVIKEDEKVSEAISALQVLGYSKREIVEALQTIEVTSLSVEDIIKKGLANLAKKL